MMRAWAREFLVWIGRMGGEREVGYVGVVGVDWPFIGCMNWGIYRVDIYQKGVKISIK